MALFLTNQCHPHYNHGSKITVQLNHCQWNRVQFGATKCDLNSDQISDQRWT